MANSSSNLDLIQQSQASKEVTSNALSDAASPAMLYGRRASTTSGLTWGYYGGTVRITAGTLSQVANGTIALTASATNYIEADPATGAVSKNTTAFTAGRVPLYQVVTGTATVTSYTDYRIADGVSRAVSEAGLAGKYDKTGGAISGDLSLAGTGRRIRGDFDNASESARLCFQTSTANAPTVPYIIPNGSSQISGLVASNSSDPNNASYVGYFVAATAAFFASGKSGTGAYVPLEFQTGGVTRLVLGVGGDASFGTTPVNSLRYFDFANADAGSSAGVIQRWITKNAAGSADTTVDLVKYKSGPLYMNNNEPSSSGVFILQTAAGDISLRPGGVEGLRIDPTSRHWLPGTDNSQNVGSGALRLKEIFCGNNVINTSDAREKTKPHTFTAAEQAAARDLHNNIGIFQFLASVAEKGEDVARQHIGMTVQSAIAIMEAHGLDPMRYGFICHDTWEERIEEIDDEAGDLVRIEQRQATHTESVEKLSVEIINGQPVLTRKPVSQDVPLFDQLPVHDEAGQPVLVHHDAVLDDAGNELQAAYDEPMLHPVPVMEDVEIRYRRVVHPAGDRYSFRTDQLIMFMLSALEVV